ncbi:RidA family protein [uncultured Roseovarius sp.]|uniref:RidA family protein n=1 Tax=uncultured Roseovarius sp. TaxID=293344 RepID=UPI002619CCF2|nr:RidA family protein [uncultured Roseovarius sp.]
MSNIERIQVGDRMSQIVIHGDTIYLAGQVGEPGTSVENQTRDCLDNVDELLAEAGSDKSRILSATIWLADMTDFDEMNAVWDAWVPKGLAPARACGEAKLALPEFAIEVMIVAAK